MDAELLRHDFHRGLQKAAFWLVGSGTGMAHFIIDGRVAGNTMTGSWNHGDSKGDFKVTKK